MSKKIILNKTEQLQKQPEELKTIEKTNNFIRSLKEALLDDKCSIILQGHNKWQFNEKYLMKDIKFEHRNSIAESLQEIIKLKQQIKENRK